MLKKIWYAVAREGYSIPFPHREIITKEAGAPFSGELASVADALGRAEILKSLDEGELRRLSEGVRVLVFGPGEEVVRQGDAGESLFIVRRGTLGVRIDERRSARCGKGTSSGRCRSSPGRRGRPRSAPRPRCA